MCVHACRPLRADECLPVLTHRLVTETVTDDTATHRHRNDSHKKKDRKVFCVCVCHFFTALMLLCPVCTHLLLE